MILGRFADIHPFDVNGFQAQHFNFAGYNQVSVPADNNDAILTGKVTLKKVCVIYSARTTGLQNSSTSATHYHFSPYLPETEYILSM